MPHIQVATAAIVHPRQGFVHPRLGFVPMAAILKLRCAGKMGLTRKAVPTGAERSRHPREVGNFF